jgi:fructokinase
MRIGIDLGGTKIEGLALADDGRELARTRMPSPRGNYGDTLAAIVTVVESLERAAGSRGSVGVGIPGALSPATGLVKNANSTWLNGQPLAGDLPRLLNRPVRFANDANCFALSEATDGAAVGASLVFGVIAGTGTGGGLVVDGRLVVGANAIAGEWGHNPMPASRTECADPPTHCYCGRQDCIETYLSGPAFERDYGKGVPAARIAERARSGEPDARHALERYADRMARALGTVINILDPDVIVLGGGLSNIEMLYDLVPERWAPYVFSDRVATRLVPAKHGDSSGVRGAAWLWPTGPYCGAE